MVTQMPPAIEFKVFLHKVRQLDLGPIAYQLMFATSGPRWTEAKTIKAIARYLSFLFLIARYPQLQLAPSQEIDEVWHQHILDTLKYAEDCQFLFGRFIHHFPYLGTRSEADRLSLERAYGLTQILFQQHFGVGMSIESEGLSADCEPLQGCAYLQAQQRPEVELAIGEVLQFFLIEPI